MATTGTLKSVVLEPGDCIVLPAGAEIQSIVLNGDASVTSTCGTLPTPENYKCGKFAMFVDQTTGTHPLDEDHTVYINVKVGDTTYVLNENVCIGGDAANPTPAGTLNLHLGTDLPIFKFTAVTLTGLVDRTLYWIYFQVPESLYDKIELKIETFGNAMYLRPYDADCGDYPNPT